ncbi:MAG: hypothetical protein RIG62_25910 [Cyclobacteriaceae bacterium]
MKKLLPAFLLMSVSLLLGCREDEIITDTPSSPVSINGYVQKGPFINGTSIIITELDDSLAATGKTFTTQIADNKGSFFIKTSQLDYTNLQLIASGFYFDEVKGEKSAAQLTLMALANISEDASINVNVLSHLEKDRVMYLINQGTGFLEAKQQAQQEILAIFSIERENMTSSELLDISQDGDNNAILLAISAILQGNQSVAELSELLADITTDIREDGTLDSDQLKATLVRNSIGLDLSEVRQHMQTRYASLGVEATIPNFEQFVDSDGDGVLNKDDDDTPQDFLFNPQENVAINTTVTSNEIIISGISEDGFITATIQNGQFVKNGEVIEQTSINLVNEDQVSIQVTSSRTYNDSVTAIVTFGTLDKEFTVITDNYLPSDFTFTKVESALRSTVYTSNTITVDGLKYPTPTKITNGVLIKNGTKLTEDSTTVINGDQLTIEVTSHPEWYNKVQTSLRIGSRENSFEVINKINLWTRLAKFPGVGSFDQVSFLLNEKMYVGLGRAKTFGATNEFYRYDPKKDEWKKIANFKGKAREQAVAFTQNGKAYVGLGNSIDGGGGNYSTLKDFWEYDPKTDVWKQIEDFPGISRAAASCMVIDENVYIGLGYNWRGYDYHLNDFWKFSAITKTWNKISNFPSKRYNTVSFSFESKGFIVGGFNSKYQDKKDIWEYNPESNNWTKKNNSILENITNGIGFTISGKAYLGTSNSNLIGEEYFYEYNPHTQAWIKLDGYRIRSGATVTVYNNDAYYFNGSEVWKYTP